MKLSFASYDAFSATAFGGSQACIVSDARALDRETRIRVAREIGYPATCFVDAVGDGSVTAQFFSTVMEQPMCGHGTVCLMTDCVERGLLDCGNTKSGVDLVLPSGTTRVTVARDGEGRVRTMLFVTVPAFRRDPVDIDRLARLLGLEKDDFDAALPIETAVADFVHLVIPVSSLASMNRMTPDFQGIVAYCHELGVGTFATFSRQAERPDSTIHVRDFCPAVGVAESASAGTTNAALAAYLVRQGLVSPNADGRVAVRAEQGIELGRPSTVNVAAELVAGDIHTLRVGGIATKTAEGVLHIPVGPRPN